MIIDRDPKKTDLIKRKLGGHGGKFRVAAVADSIEKGIKAIEKHRPAIVFADINMTGEEGSTLPERLQKWDFDIIITQNGGFYRLISKEKQSAGFIMKKIELTSYFV